VGLERYIEEHAKVDRDEGNEIRKQIDHVVRRPWAPHAYPHIAAWLKMNEKPLALAVAASKRPAYFSPLVPAEASTRGLIAALIPGVYGCRAMATALAARAMVHVNEGRLDHAWQDLLPCHRLSRLVGRGPLLTEVLASLFMERVAGEADLAFLDGTK